MRYLLRSSPLSLKYRACSIQNQYEAGLLKSGDGLVHTSIKYHEVANKIKTRAGKAFDHSAVAATTELCMLCVCVGGGVYVCTTCGQPRVGSSGYQEWLLEQKITKPRLEKKVKLSRQ